MLPFYVYSWFSIVSNLGLSRDPAFPFFHIYEYFIIIISRILTSWSFFCSLICSEKSEEAVGVSLCFSLCCITYSDPVDRVQILYHSFLLHGSPHQHYWQHELASSWGPVSYCQLLHYVHVLVSAFLMGARRRNPEIHMVMRNRCRHYSPFYLSRSSSVSGTLLHIFLMRKHIYANTSRVIH